MSPLNGPLPTTTEPLGYPGRPDGSGDNHEITAHCGHKGTPERKSAGTIMTSHHWREPRSVTFTSHETVFRFWKVGFGANHPVEYPEVSPMDVIRWSRHVYRQSSVSRRIVRCESGDPQFRSWSAFHCRFSTIAESRW